MARSSAAEVEKQPTPNISTNWSAAFSDVGGEGASSLDPNEISPAPAEGQPQPTEVLEQFDALADAARAIIGRKVMGMDVTFNITLEGVATSGQDDPSQYVKLTIAKGPSSLSPNWEPTGANPVYVVSQDYPAPDWAKES